MSDYASAFNEAYRRMVAGRNREEKCFLHVTFLHGTFELPVARGADIGLRARVLSFNLTTPQRGKFSARHIGVLMPIPTSRGHHPYIETKCCLLHQTSITTAYNRARRSRQLASLSVESWSPRGVQTPKSCPVASTGVQFPVC